MESGQDLERCQRGIIYLDETDKIRKSGSNVSISRDVSGEGEELYNGNIFFCLFIHSLFILKYLFKVSNTHYLKSLKDMLLMFPRNQDVKTPEVISYKLILPIYYSFAVVPFLVLNVSLIDD